MEFLVTRRVARERSTPRFHSPTRVLRRPKARMAMVIPRMVSPLRRRWRRRLRRTILRMYIDQNTLVQVADGAGLFSGAGIVGDHDDRLAQLAVQASHQTQNLS